MNEPKKKAWKLFGKLNIIDLLIILVLIVAAVVLATRTLSSQGVTVNAQHVRVHYYGFNAIRNYVPENFTVGDPVTQYDTNLDLGTLNEFSYIPSYYWVYDYNRGELVKVESEFESFIQFTSDCYGKLDETGLTIGSTTFVVGGNYYFNVGPTRAGYQISGFELLDD